ncbi:DnaJ domain-containing protein [Dichomitus squalens]|nr:DnaJ domain-containing protein [Dichomitus squalens]
MAHRHSTVAEAYTILGLEQDASLEVVKTTYKQLALKTHPDKNPDDADATAQFQKISQAYNTLVRHLDRSSAPSHGHSHGHYHPFGYDDDDDYDDEYDYDYEDEDYDDYEDDYEDMEFYRYLFEELLRGRASRFAHAQYHRHHPHNHRPPSPPETPEQYSARLRKQVEEQEKAAERRARDEADRKAEQEREREQERREAEKRQRQKASAKKASAEASRKTAEEKARAQQEQLQTIRSQIFAAARKNDAAAVKKGVWEQNVDAAGGEIRKGSEAFVKTQPADPKETLLHIAAKNGDVDLVEWLDSHSAEPEERNGEGMTAFHIALQGGNAKIVNHFFENYSPKDGDHEGIYHSPESKSNLHLALDSKEPEVVWLVLEKKLYTKEERDAAWDIVQSKKFKSSISPTDKHVEFVNLFATYGGYSLDKPVPAPESSSVTEPVSSSPQSPRVNSGGVRRQNGRPPRPIVRVDDSRSHTASPVSAVSEHPQTPQSATSTNSQRGFRGQHYHRGSYRPHQQFHGHKSDPASPIDPGTYQQDGAPGQQAFNGHRGRGRGRGQLRGRGRGRGRGEPSVQSAPAAA